MMISNTGYYNEPPKTISKGNENDPIIKRAMMIHREGDELFGQRREEIVEIMATIKAATTVRPFGANGAVFVDPRLLYNAVESHLNKEDFIKWDIDSVELDTNISNTVINSLAISDQLSTRKKKELEEQLANSLYNDYIHKISRVFIDDILNDAGFSEAFTDKYGIRKERAVKGDSYAYVSNDSGKLRIETLKLDNLKVRKSATSFQQVLKEHKELVLVFDVDDYDDFIERFPDNEKAKNLEWGMLPQYSGRTDMRMTRSNQEGARKGQYAAYLCWKKGKERVIYYGGLKAEIFKDYEGKEYPFRDNDDEATCPLFHYYFQTTNEGFYNNGLGDILYQVNSLQGFNDNNKILIARRASMVYNILQANPDKQDDIEQMIIDMRIQESNGQIPFGVYDSDEPLQQTQLGGGSGGINDTSVLDGIIQTETTAAGVNLQGVGAEKGKPLGSFQLELQNAVAQAEKVGSDNAEEFKRMLEYVYELAIATTSEADDTPLNIKEVETTIPIPEFNTEVTERINTKMTRGLAIKFLKLMKPFFSVEPMSGAKSNPVLELAMLERDLSILQGTPYMSQVLDKIAKQRGYTMSNTGQTGQENQPEQETEAVRPEVSPPVLSQPLQ